MVEAMMKKILYPFILLNLLSPVSHAKKYKFQYQKTIEVGRLAELDVFNQSGDVSITGIDSDNINISAVKFIAAENQEEAEKLGEYLEIKASRDANRITIRTEHHRTSDKQTSLIKKLLSREDKLYGSINYDIKVPYECRIDLENFEGNVKIDGINADMDITVTSGDLDLQNISGDIEIESTSGKIGISKAKGDILISSAASEVTLKETSGTVDITSSSGDKIGEELSGPVTIMQSSGRIDLNKLSGNVRIKSSSGNINIEQIQGAINVLANSGDINISTELNSSDDYFIETEDGNILFEVPADASGRVKLESNTGEIITDMPLSIDTFSRSKISGSFGQNGPQITLITSSGDIRLNGQ